MAEYMRTEGICLRRFDYSNTSQVVALLTPDQGRLSFIAKGARRAPKRGVSTGFDLLARYEVLYTTRPYGSLQNLTYRWMVEDFRGLRASLPPLLCGYYAAELLLNFTVEADPCPGLYELALDTLGRLAQGRALGAAVLRLEAGVLVDHGAYPAFDRCTRCDGRLPDGGVLTFSPPDGGAICADCTAQGAPGTMPFQHDLAATLEALGRSEEPPAGPPRRLVALSAVLRFHMRYLLGKELRMWRYLQRRQLSRALERVRRRASRAPRS